MPVLLINDPTICPASLIPLAPPGTSIWVKVPPVSRKLWIGIGNVPKALASSLAVSAAAANAAAAMDRTAGRELTGNPPCSDLHRDPFASGGSFDPPEGAKRINSCRALELENSPRIPPFSVDAPRFILR